MKKNKQINPKTIEDAKKYTILTNTNSMDHIWLENNGFTKLETSPKVKNAIKMFFKGRADMIAFDDSVIKDEFKNLGFNYADVVQVIPLFKTPPYMAVSLSTSDVILKKLQNAYDQLLKEKKIELVN